MLKPIKGMIAIAVDEDGKWVAMGGDNDPGAKDSANSARECLYDTGHVGMIQVYLKPVEFWPATVETLGDKPLIQNTTEMSLIENVDESVSMLFGDGEATIDNEIAKALEKLKSLVRLRAYVKSEVSYYETDSRKTAEDSVKEAMAMVSGKPSAIAVSRVERSVERKIEQTHKETVTVTNAAENSNESEYRYWSDVSDNEIYEALKSPLQMLYLVRALNVRYRYGDVDAKARLAMSGRFIQRGAWWWRKEDHDEKYGQSDDGSATADDDQGTSCDEQPVTTGLRTWDGVTDDEITDFLTPKAKKGVEIARHFGLSRNGMDDRLRQNDRVMNSHVWWKMRPVDEDFAVDDATVDDEAEPEAEPETNGTTAVAKADNTTRAGERPVETPPARLSSRQVEIKPCDKCGGPLGDGIRPFACPVCDVSKTIDTVDDSNLLPVSRSVDRADPRGQTAGQIESCIRQRVRQSKNGMMLISDIAEELDVGEGAIVDVVSKMNDMGRTGARVIQKPVK